MNTMKLSKTLLATAATAVVATGAAFAGNLTPGTSIAPVPSTTETGVLITSQTDPFTAPLGTYSGSLYSAVYKEATGTLDFVFQVKNNSGSTDDLSRIEGGNFLGFDTSAFFSTQAGGLGTGTQAPDSAFMTKSGGVGFNFLTAGNANLAAGTTSDLLVVKTNATMFTSSLEGVSDNTTVNVASYSPSLSTPEPATVVPFALGGLALLGLIVRKTRRAGAAA